MHKAIEKYCRDCVLAFLVISLFISPLAVVAEQDSSRGEQPISKTARQRLRTPITYSCVEKPIETVLMDLAEQAQVDIVKSPKVTGNVTVKVTDVPLEEALTNILAAHDYTYIATESMIRVVPLPEIAVLREKLVTRIYQITYADANEVAVALTNFVSPQGRVALNRGTSHIMVTDTETKIKGIDKFIEQIDHRTPQVLVEARIYDITSKEGFELGADWHVARNAPLTYDSIFPTETTTTVIGPSSTTYSEDRTDTTDSTEYIDGFYRDADDGPGFMNTDVDSTVTRDEDSTTIDSGRTDTETKTIEPHKITNLRRKPFVGASLDRIRGGTLSFSLLNDAVDIELALNILHKQVEAKLLANPRILVLDNQTAKFEIVREIPYRELRQVAREDPITYTEFKKVGVQLNVTPHIARDGMIRLHIVPEFGVLVSQGSLRALTGLDFYQDALRVPTIDVRRADTTAMIKDGQTIVISGLRKRETTKDISKVPLLGDIPIVGGLFKAETESVITRELVIFITTRIITEPVLSAIEKSQFDATEFLGPKMMKVNLERKAREPDITELLRRLLQKTGDDVETVSR